MSLFQLDLMKNSPLVPIIPDAITVMSMEASCSGGSQPSLPRLDSQTGNFGSAQAPAQHCTLGFSDKQVLTGKRQLC